LVFVVFAISAPNTAHYTIIAAVTTQSQRGPKKARALAEPC
jgi:hypothetical protein